MARFNGKSRDTDLEIVHPGVERYLYELCPRSEAVLAEMEARAEREDIPIVGPLVGRLFHLLARANRAKRVMELGSAIGYSTIWWALAVGPTGKVFYTDSGERELAEARDYCRRAGVAERIEFLQGDAVTRMTEVDGTFDIVFCDIDKDGYPAALEPAAARVRAGGLFVIDNTLWSGRVLDNAAGTKGDRDTAAIQEFNSALYERKDLFTVVLPLRDGVTVALKT
jgi:predicted O-methyltransferase YrrM